MNDLCGGDAKQNHYCPEKNFHQHRKIIFDQSFFPKKTGNAIIEIGKQPIKTTTK